jgi:hypothetical protein
MAEVSFRTLRVSQNTFILEVAATTVAVAVGVGVNKNKFLLIWKQARAQKNIDIVLGWNNKMETVDLHFLACW